MEAVDIHLDTTLKWITDNAKKEGWEICPGETSEVWVTKERGDYITHVGLEKELPIGRFGITEQVASSWDPGKPINHGFNPEEQKWYGWSHRAIYGFGIGSECKKGQCHYHPSNPDDFLEDMVRFWDDEHHDNTRGEHTVVDGVKGVQVTWDYTNDVPNEDLRGTISGCFQPYPEKWGRGEWIAETLDEAKQMAIDFAEGVS